MIDSGWRSGAPGHPGPGPAAAYDPGPRTTRGRTRPGDGHDPGTGTTRGRARPGDGHDPQESTTRREGAARRRARLAEGAPRPREATRHGRGYGRQDNG